MRDKITCSPQRRPRIIKTLTVLGSTGSIGTNALDVIQHNRHLYDVYALVAGHNVETLAAQIVEFHPKIAVVATGEDLARLSSKRDEAGSPRSAWPVLLWGNAGRIQAATAAEVDMVISAIVG